MGPLAFVTAAHGLSRFPVKLLDMADEIRSFIKDDESRLKKTE
jgi:hypothetical protein